MALTARSLVVSTALAFALAAPAAAQTYPDRTVKIIVPQPPGGGFDTVARILADRLGPLLGQGMVVENRVGAGTLVGTEAAAKAPADGYTLLLGGLSNIALNPGLYAKLPYDPLKDFTPIGLAVNVVLHDGGAQGAALQGPQGAGRIRPRQSGENHLRVGRQGFRPARRHGRHRAARRRQAHTRGL